MRPRHRAEEPAGRKPLPEPTPQNPRVAPPDKALAELEAELFAAAKQVDRERRSAGRAVRPETSLRRPSTPRAEAGRRDASAEHARCARPDADPSRRTNADIDAATARRREPAPKPRPTPTRTPRAVIAKVRKLMLVSMAVTVIAVGSVFGFIGYRMFKGEGSDREDRRQAARGLRRSRPTSRSRCRAARASSRARSRRPPGDHARNRRQDRGAHLRREDACSRPAG